MITEAKRLNSRELVSLVDKLLTDPIYVEQLSESHVYSKLMEGIVGAITNVCGGEVSGKVQFVDDNELFSINVEWNDKVPETGGIWDQIDEATDWDITD